MDDAAPTILRLSSPDWDADSAARRIAQLETALMRRSELLEQKQAQIDAWQSSGAWQAVRWYYKLRERLLPLHSRRRRLVRTAMGLAARSVRSVIRRITGRDLAHPDAGGEGDRVALDTESDDLRLRNPHPNCGHVANAGSVSSASGAHAAAHCLSGVPHRSGLLYCF